MNTKSTPSRVPYAIFLSAWFFWSVGSHAGPPDHHAGALEGQDPVSVHEIHEMIRDVYLQELDREPDREGLRAYAAHILEGGRDAEWLAGILRDSEEARILRGEGFQENDVDRYVAFNNVREFMVHYRHIPISLGLALALGLIISQVYKHTHRGMNYELSFMSTLVLLAPIVALVMLFIRGDLVLSLGLIGSLSIIRFRTPIKDTRDMIFLFWVIAVGLGAGTFNWMVVILATLIMVPIVFLLYFVKYGRANQADFILVCGGEGPYPVHEIEPVIAEVIKDASIRSHEVSGDVWETVYELRGAEAGAGLISALVQKLNQLPSVHKVSLLAPKLDLPV